MGTREYFLDTHKLITMKIDPIFAFLLAIILPVTVSLSSVRPLFKNMTFSDGRMDPSVPFQAQW